MVKTKFQLVGLMLLQMYALILSYNHITKEGNLLEVILSLNNKLLPT